MKIVHVAIDVPRSNLFDYSLDEATQKDIGKRVIVSFGKRKTIGIILAVDSNSQMDSKRLKPVIKILGDASALDQHVLKLLRFASAYYHHPIGETVLHAVPAGLRKAKLPAAVRKVDAYRLTEAGGALDLKLFPVRAKLKRLLMQQFHEKSELACAQPALLSARSKRLLKEFIARGWVEEVSPGVPVATIHASGHPPLNAAQEQIVNTLLSSQDPSKPWLLFGITGSGKTEVYLRIIEHELKRGKQTLVLVPEINLTPQLEQVFRARFRGAQIACLHSGLNASERLVDWLSAQSGRSQIILGTRLAVFTPLPNLGLIIVDEEHDASFKQQDGLRYSARDLAVFRAQQLNVPIILGSATPALETFHNALNGRYRLIELPERARQGAGLPSIQCVDTRTGRVDDGLSDKVLQAIEQRLAQKQQSMVFINRRGYAPVLMCGQCGWISACQRCSSRLVLHLVQSQLHCHQCGLQIALPLTCPECGAVQLLPIGHGTQRIEAALHKFFPAARILRFDRDSIRRKHALKTMLDRIHDEDVDILVGTQLLSKGHDFKKLALVAAVNVDSALFSPDFRSTERLFAQLTQVAGRAGRASVDAEVLIQTAFPGHPLFSALRGHDYRAFAKVMLDERRQAGFPPYCYQAILRAEALQLGTALRFLKDAANHSPRKSFPVTVFDPVQAPMPRVSGKWRAHLLIQSSSRKSLQEFLHVWLEPLRQLRSSKVRWSVDVDPYEL